MLGRVPHTTGSSDMLSWRVFNISLRYEAIFCDFGRFGAIWASVQKDFFTIDYEGLYDEPIVHAVGEIARAPCPITFQ